MSKTWLNKPPIGSVINWGHPLSNGLVGVYLFNENIGSKLYDLAKNKNDGTITGPTWLPSIEGPSLSFDGVTDRRVDFLNFKFNKAGPYSIVTISITDTVTGAGYIFNQRDFVTANIVFMIDRSNGVDARFIVGIDPTAKTLTLTNIFAKNIPVTLVATRSSVGVMNFYGFGNKCLTAVSDTIAGTTSSPYAPRIGSQCSDAAAKWSGKILYTLVYNRVLSYEEAKSLYVNPYQFIYKPIKRTYFISSAASAITYAPQPLSLIGVGG